MQFLVRGTPQLSVQFLNDMIINATEKKAPIHILLRIPNFHVLRQDGLEIISTEEDKLKMKKKETDVEQETLRNKVNLNEELCPENVDLLNISHAYSTAVPKIPFGGQNLFIEVLNIIYLFNKADGHKKINFHHEFIYFRLFK